MLTGDIRNQIDRIWDAFWSGGISNPLEVIDNTMLRIGSMNMLLHGVENPDIRYRDSLAQEHAGEDEKYTLVLANPPSPARSTTKPAPRTSNSSANSPATSPQSNG